MKIANQNWKQALAALFFFFGLFTSNASLQAQNDCTCGAPEIVVNSHLQSSISFSWNAVENATAYNVWYHRKEDNFTSQVVIATNSSVLFSNLTDGTYMFYFKTVCGNQTSGIIITDDLMM